MSTRMATCETPSSIRYSQWHSHNSGRGLDIVKCAAREHVIRSSHSPRTLPKICRCTYLVTRTPCHLRSCHQSFSGRFLSVVSDFYKERLMSCSPALARVITSQKRYHFLHHHHRRSDTISPSHLLVPSSISRINRFKRHRFAVPALPSDRVGAPRPEEIDPNPCQKNPAKFGFGAQIILPEFMAVLSILLATLMPLAIPPASYACPQNTPACPIGTETPPRVSLSSLRSISQPPTDPFTTSRDLPPRTFPDPATRTAAASNPATPAGASDTSIEYNTFVVAHEKRVSKRSLFTPDAWEGMVRLREYDELVEKMGDEEKECRECTKNRRLLEQVWQTVSNGPTRPYAILLQEFFDPTGNFSQSNWSGELAKSLRKAGGPLKTKSQTYVAMKDMVSHLNDRWSAFLEPSQYRLAIHRPIPREINYLAFQYTGIGIEVCVIILPCRFSHLQLGGPSPLGGRVIIAPFAGSPAEEGGIRGGDHLLSIDGRSISTRSVEESVKMLRGPAGSSVHQLNPRTYWVLYLRLHYFSGEGSKGMAAAIRAGEGLGVDGYILDLRNNPGGVFEEAIAMAALWVDCDSCQLASTVRSTKGSDDVSDSVYQQNQLPVLVGALRDNGRAVVIGEDTFGKGVVQYYFPMDDGSGLKLTVAKYLTPSKYDISKNGGIPPDIRCDDFPRPTHNDECIQQGMKVVMEERAGRERAMETEGQELPYGRMPYRWIPSMNDRVWAVRAD